MGILKPPFPQLQHGDKFARNLIFAAMFHEGSGTKLNDLSGQASVSTFHGAPAWTAGRNGAALSFAKATPDYISFANAPVIPAVFTMAIRFKMNSASASEIDILDKANNRRIVGVRSSHLFGYAGSTGVADGATTLSPGDWHLGIFSYGDGGSTVARLYLDGKRDVDTTINCATDTSTDIYINAQAGPVGEGDVTVDLAMIWGKWAFTADDAKMFSQRYGV